MLTAIIIFFLAVIFFVSFFVTSKVIQKKNNPAVEKQPKSAESVPSDDEPKINFCPYCGEKLPENEKICPGCGKNIFNKDPQHHYCPHCKARVPHGAIICWKCFRKLKVDEKTKRQYKIIFPIIAFIFVFFIIIASTSKRTVAKAQPSNVFPSQTAVQSVPTVGDTVEKSGIKVTFNGVKESKGSQFVEPASGNIFLLCELTIQNESSSDITVSSLMSFECYIDDYATSLSITALMDDTVNKQLDGTIAPGKKMRGYVGYEVPRNWSDVEIRFVPSLGSARDFVFNYSK